MTSHAVRNILYISLLFIINIYTAENTVTTQQPYTIKFSNGQHLVLKRKTADLLKRESTVIHDLTSAVSTTKIPLAIEYIDKQTINLLSRLLTSKKSHPISHEDTIKIIRAADYLDIPKLKQPLLEDTTLAQLVTYCKQNPHTMRNLPMVAQDSLLSPLVTSVTNSIKQIICEMRDQQVTQLFGDKLVTSLHRPYDSVGSAVFSPDSTRLVTVSHLEGIARIWNADDGTRLLTVPNDTGSVELAIFSPDNTRLVTISTGKKAHIRNAADGELLHTLQGNTGLVESVEWCSDCTYLAMVSGDHTVRIFNAGNGTLLHTLQYNVSPSIAFSPDGTRLAITLANGTVRILNPDDGMLSLLLTLQNNTAPVLWNHDGTRLATTSSNNITHIWNADCGTLLGTTQVNIGSSHKFDEFLDTMIENINRVGSIELDNDDTFFVHTPMSRIGMTIMPFSVWNNDYTRLATTSNGNITRIWNIPLLEKLDHIVQIMNGTQIIAAASITQRLFEDVPTSILEILPTELINILITRVNPSMTEKLEAVLRIRSQKSLRLQEQAEINKLAEKLKQNMLKKKALEKQEK